MSCHLTNEKQICHNLAENKFCNNNQLFIVGRLQQNFVSEATIFRNAVQQTVFQIELKKKKYDIWSRKGIKKKILVVESFNIFMHLHHRIKCIWEIIIVVHNLKESLHIKQIFNISLRLFSQKKKIYWVKEKKNYLLYQLVFCGNVTCDETTFNQ